MSTSNSPWLPHRIRCAVLLAAVAAGAPGCGGAAGVIGGSDETISTGEGQAVVPKQELINLGQTEQSLAPPARKVR